VLRKMLIRYGWITYVKRDWNEFAKEREYNCAVDGKKLSWVGLSHHFRLVHREIYERLEQIIELRIFTLQESLVYKGKQTPTNKNMTVELQEVKPVPDTLPLPQIVVEITSDGYAHCECGGRYKNCQSSDRKLHEATKMHKAYLESVIIAH
jgi:hypothetical protein